MRISLTPHQLAAFLALARAGSFSAAAAQRGVTQSALSRIIQHMETQLDRPLFDRTTRSVELTPTGHELLPIAERIVAEFDEGLGELARFVEGRRGRITVAALPSIAAVLLPPAMARFSASAPDVEFAILDGLSGSVLDAVAEGRADIGLTIQPDPQAALVFRRPWPSSSPSSASFPRPPEAGQSGIGTCIRRYRSATVAACLPSRAARLLDVETSCVSSRP